MRRLLPVTGVLAACLLATLWPYFPVCVGSPWRGPMRVDLPAYGVSPAEAERAWLPIEERILGSYPGCTLRWAFQRTIQHIEVGGLYDGAEARRMIADWARQRFPIGASTSEAGGAPVEPFLTLSVDAPDWASTQFWVTRVLSPMLLCMPEIRRIEIEPPMVSTLMIRINPSRLAERCVSLREIEGALMESASSGVIGPFQFQGRGIFLPNQPVRDVASLRFPSECSSHPIALRDLAEIQAGYDMGTPIAYRDGRPCVLVRIFTLAGSGHSRLFAEIMTKLRESQSEERVSSVSLAGSNAAQGLLARILGLGAMLAIGTAAVLRWSGASLASSIRLPSGVLVGACLYPLAAYVIRGACSIEGVLGWGIGLLVAFVMLVKAHTRKRRREPVAPVSASAPVAMTLGLLLTAFTCFVGLSIAFWTTSTLIPWEASIACLMSAVVPVALGGPIDGPVTSSRVRTITSLAAKLRHAFLRRGGLLFAFSLFAFACGAPVMWQEIGHQPDNRKAEFARVRFDADMIDPTEIEERLKRALQGRPWWLRREGGGWVLTCTAADQADVDWFESRLSQALGSVSFVNRPSPADGDSFGPYTEIPDLAGLDLLPPMPATETSLYLTISHHDRAAVSSQAQILAADILKMKGVTGVDYTGAKQVATYTVVPSGENNRNREHEATAILAATQPGGIKIGNVLWGGTVREARLVVGNADAVSGRAVPWSWVQSLLLNDRAATEDSVQHANRSLATIGQVLEIQKAAEPAELARTDGKAVETLRISTRDSGSALTNAHQRDQIAAQIRMALLSMGVTWRLDLGNRPISEAQRVMLAIGIAAIACATICGLISNIPPRALALRGIGCACTLLTCAFVMPSRFTSQQALILVACGLMFLCGTSGESRHPSWGFGIELVLLGLVTPLVLLAFLRLPLTESYAMTVLAGSLAIGEFWMGAGPEALLGGRRRLERLRFQGDRDGAMVLNALTHVYAGDVRALDRVSLRIGPGVYGVLGPNGAGKTTLLRVLARQLKPTSGSIYVDRSNMLDLHPTSALVTMVSQDPGAYTSMRVMDYLSYIASLEHAHPAAVERALEVTGLAAMTFKRIGELSGGYRRRLDIARAVLSESRVVILDEPTSGLDPEVRVPIRKLVTELGLNRIVIMATHLVEDVEAVCSHLAILHQGRVLYEGPTSDAIKMADGMVYAGMVSVSERARLVEAGGLIVGQAKAADGWIVRFIGREVAAFDATPQQPSLEDAYVMLLGTSGPEARL